MPKVGPGVTTGAGSPPQQVANFTAAGVAVRNTTADPVDSDWGTEPPPNGTLVVDNTNLILWVRANGTWRPIFLT